MTKELEVYLHIPFCVQKCHYCDFLSFPCTEEQQEQYFHALLSEVKHFFASEEYVSEKYRISTVFFGGGTPSVLDAEKISLLLSCIPGHPNEVTLEANPGTLNVKKLTAYRQAGINRLSLGLQSCDAQMLRLLGRIHTWEEFLENFAQARNVGFQNINVDLMSGLPTQTTKDWEQVLHRVASLLPEHISAYSLILEENTPFFAHYSKHPEVLPTEEEVVAMYEITEELLAAYGYHPYEISNYALPEKECQHNVGYWYRKNYIGFGLGAASLLGNQRFHNTQDQNKYISVFHKNKIDLANIREEVQTLSTKEQMEETMFLGLRCIRGVSAEKFFQTFGVSMKDIYGDVIERYEKQGFLVWEQDRLCLTKRAFLVSNCIMQDFLQ